MGKGKTSEREIGSFRPRKIGSFRQSKKGATEEESRAENGAEELLIAAARKAPLPHRQSIIAAFGISPRENIQYSVETYVKLETSCLEFHRNRQQHLRTEIYQGLMDSMTNSETLGSNIGKRIIFPVYKRSQRLCRRYMDAMSFVQRRHNDGRNVVIRNHELNNLLVIPYNAYLLANFDCRINVKICSAIEVMKYIYKWICALEAMWRIFAFDLTNIHPSVMTMHLHLENYQSISFTENQALQDVLANERNSRTMLIEFFSMNRTNKRAQDLNCARIWIERKRGEVISHVNTAHPIEGERYYLRMLLMHVRKPTSFDDLKSADAHLESSYKEAAKLRGLLQADNGFDECLSNVLVYNMPISLRQLFAVLLVHYPPTNPRTIWLKFENYLSEDIKKNLALSQQQVQIQVLRLIDQHIQIMEKDISDYKLTDIPYHLLCSDNSAKEIEAEYQIPISDKDLVSISMLNRVHKFAFDKIMEKVNANVPVAFFIDGPSGTGNHFL
ncbi:uncharacterized protein [Coffea arabica]|uniref:ATP-dependent DNA helicase n=1 Tax=Coffea arabica TaxID=13443 RepID=A0A6P6SPS8_COFAR|nr:uncharacterized protein LOC113693561 [Coffea arabica]